MSPVSDQRHPESLYPIQRENNGPSVSIHESISTEDSIYNLKAEKKHCVSFKHELEDKF